MKIPIIDDFENMVRGGFREFCRKYDIYWFPVLAQALQVIFILMLVIAIFQMNQLNQTQEKTIKDWFAKNPCPCRSVAYSLLSGGIAVNDNVPFNPYANISSKIVKYNQSGSVKQNSDGTCTVTGAC